MLAAAMDDLLSPLFTPGRIRLVPLRGSLPPEMPALPGNLLYPVDESSLPKVLAGQVPLPDLADGAIYMLCYQPLHRNTQAYRQLSQAYVQVHAPGYPAHLMAEARQAESDGDWVGAVGRLWTLVQLEPLVPEYLDELAQACFFFGFGAAGSGERDLAARLARASAAALNTLLEEFPDYGPGHVRRAEFLASMGDTSGASRAVAEAIRLGVSPAEVDDALEMLRQAGAADHSGSEKSSV